MILDDIFSGLDRVTARRIFFGLFSSDGLLRRLRTTVILATHSRSYLIVAHFLLIFSTDKRLGSGVFGRSGYNSPIR